MSYHDVDVTTIDENSLITHYESVPTKITHTSFDGEKTVFDDYDVDFYLTDESVQDQLQDPLNGLRYYADKKKLLVSKSLDQYIDDYHGEGFDGLITYFNHTDRTINKFYKEVTKAKQAIVEDHYFTGLSNFECYWFTNLPSHLYNHLVIAYQSLMYSINDKKYLCRHMTYPEIISVRDNLVANGLQHPLVMKLFSDGTLLPDGCAAEVLMCILLGLDSIPVAITPNKYEDQRPTMTRFTPSDNKQEMSEFVFPYFQL